jgi:RHS repeat-associated protein
LVYTRRTPGNLTSKRTSNYTYADTGDANPDAVTQIANGLASTSYGYDNDGNLTSAGTSTFSWDYNNRMTQAVTQGSTSTFSYDLAGNRVSQTVGSTTTSYPNKWYSITSTTNGGTTYATSTVYVWNGDTLIATIDQPMVNGSATGTAATRYIHPDHLGSTNVVSDATGSVVEAEDFYPYGGLRVDTKTSGYGGVRNKYAGTIYDALSGLNYAQARYQNSNRGQFISEDPVFLGDPKQQVLSDPQQLNSYNYAFDNPVDLRRRPTVMTTTAILPAGTSTFN